MIVIRVLDPAGRTVTRLFLGCDEIVGSLTSWLLAHGYRALQINQTFHPVRSIEEDLLARYLIEQYHLETHHDETTQASH